MSDFVARLNAQLAVPMGFTLTASAVLAASISRWPQPDALMVWLFCAGGLAAHAFIVVAVRTLRYPPRVVSASAFVNVVPLLAIPVTTLFSEWIADPRIGYPVSGALAVVTYVGGLGFYFALIARATSTRRPASDAPDVPTRK